MRIICGILLAIISCLPLLHCSMFEDIELYSGMDVENIGVDIYLATTPPNNLYISTDKGQSFSQKPLVNGNYLFWAVNKNNALLTAEGDAGNNTHIILYPPDSAWVEKGYFPTSSSVLALTEGPGGEFYLGVNENGPRTLYILQPGASAIQPVNITGFTFSISNIWAIVLNGVTNIYIADSGALYRSTDGGMSFTHVQNFGSPIVDMVQFHNEIYFVAGGSIYKSSDGNTFGQISGLSGVHSLCAFTDRIFAASATQIYFSFDGNTWLAGTNIGDLIGVDYTGRLYIAEGPSVSLYASDDGGVSSYLIQHPGFSPTAIRVVSYRK